MLEFRCSNEAVKWHSSQWTPARIKNRIEFSFLRNWKQITRPQSGTNIHWRPNEIFLIIWKVPFISSSHHSSFILSISVIYTQFIINLTTAFHSDTSFRILYFIISKLF
ncbi:unnamed protein product [Blepharisma stoltei]|uniref:Uncharacterized protein n=1 Tax=Blepharisma stoltei TaxID=1481888 RepID=A0AAU9JQJ0_9CILI|nr:unnamed protein product [Blepharisma stoltei]